MTARQSATTFGLAGGLGILLGGSLQLLLDLASRAAGPGLAPIVPALAGSCADFVIGFLVLLACRPRVPERSGRSFARALWLVLLGVGAGAVADGFVLTIAGAALSVLAGSLLAAEQLFARGFGSGWSWRRWL